jgi:hypothetical protein
MRYVIKNFFLICCLSFFGIACQNHALEKKILLDDRAYYSEAATKESLEGTNWRLSLINSENAPNGELSFGSKNRLTIRFFEPKLGPYTIDNGYFSGGPFVRSFGGLVPDSYAVKNHLPTGTKIDPLVEAEAIFSATVSASSSMVFLTDSERHRFLKIFSSSTVLFFTELPRPRSQFIAMRQLNGRLLRSLTT